LAIYFNLLNGHLIRRILGRGEEGRKPGSRNPIKLENHWTPVFTGVVAFTKPSIIDGLVIRRQKPQFVIPAKAGIQEIQLILAPRLSGGDGFELLSTRLSIIGNTLKEFPIDCFLFLGAIAQYVGHGRIRIFFGRPALAIAGTADGKSSPSITYFGHFPG
jgi:hypothetical protein